MVSLRLKKKKFRAQIMLPIYRKHRQTNVKNNLHQQE